jgi:adenylate cyclase
VRPPLSRARELAEQLLRLAKGSDEPTHHMMAHYAFGYSMFCLGELPAARHHLETSLEHYAPEQHRSALYSDGQDPGAACRAQRAWVLWLMGYPDQAAAANRDALMLARELAHPFSLAHGLWIASGVARFRGEAELAQDYAEEGIELASKHGFALWQAYLTGMRGWALTAQGQGAVGRAELRRGLDAERATGAERRQFFLTMLAEACVAEDRCEEGLKALADAQMQADRTGERWWQAEIHRMRGVLLTRSRAAPAEVEDCFRQALDVARRQAARSLELRAATSLARLWQGQGRADDARALLAPIYDWFTEGFDTADLKSARALLDELGSNRPRGGAVCSELEPGRDRQLSGETMGSRSGR